MRMQILPCTIAKFTKNRNRYILRELSVQNQGYGSKLHQNFLDPVQGTLLRPRNFNIL